MARTRQQYQSLQKELNNHRQKQIREYIRLRCRFLYKKLIAKRIAKFIFKHYIIPKRIDKLLLESKQW